MKIGLTAKQLKLIAVITMVCDHIAWAALDFFTPLAQIMHVIGRVTIPVMCFFVAEGFRHTRNLEKYIWRMTATWIISIYPFYMFFNQLYGLRQNILFDLLLGLLALTILESEKCNKIIKGVLVTVLFILSLLYGGWPVVPILFILVFYYKDTFRKKAIWSIGITLILQIVVIGYSLVNQKYQFSQITWSWNEKLYLLGFVLALPLLKRYNGKLGTSKNFKYVFYALYPLHFFIIKFLFQYISFPFFDSYVYLHVITTLLIIMLGGMAIKSKPSRAQMSNAVLVSFALFFMVGYYIELTTRSLEVVIAVIKVEYFGMTGIVMAFTWFIDEFCESNFPKWVYKIEAVVTLVVLIVVFTLEQNTLFYRSLEMRDYVDHALVFVRPGVLYYAYYAYFTLAFFILELVCIRKMKKSEGIARKRCIWIVAGTFCPCFFMFLKCIGFTNNYDFMTFGVLGFIYFFTVALIKYDYFDSIQTVAEMDALTGVSNRKYFTERVQLYLTKRTYGSMIMLDMDNFKYINDNYGHGTGDKVLITLGETLKEIIGQEHLICRLGGDEFCVFLVNVTRRSDIQRIADSVIESFHHNLNMASFKGNATVSLGIAISYGRIDEKFEHIYENADKALYLAKNSGKCQCKFYEK